MEEALFQETGVTLWHTEKGERYLKGAEASIFADALSCLANILVPEEGCPLGIKVFDQLSYPQQIAVLYEIGNALLREDVPCPELTAVREGAVATVFEYMYQMICVEVGDPDNPRRDWREKVVKAMAECEIDDPTESSCEDTEEWKICVESLSSRILWDIDYTGADFLDHPPEQSSLLKEMLGIPDDYYTQVPADPPEGDTRRLLTELNSLLKTIE